MTSVYCFSGSGHSYAIAEYFARELQVPVVNIDRRLAESHYQADLAVVIFPVYCQNIPAVVRDFFSKLTPSTWSSSPHTAKSLTEMCCGRHSKSYVGASLQRRTCPWGTPIWIRPHNSMLTLYNPFLRESSIPGPLP